VTTLDSGPGCTDISELLNSHPPGSQSKPLILQHPSHGYGLDEGSNGSSYINWLCELYPSVLESPNTKDKLSSFEETPPPPPPHSSNSPITILPITNTQPSKNYTREQVDTVFSSQEKYVVTLGAPISIAQRMGEDTLTYLNKGQFYSLFCKANSSTTTPELVKSVVYLTFFDEPDSRVEHNNWQYWYSLQANPNQKAFDIDRKSCENIQGKPVDLAYNVTSYVWRPELGSKLVLRINCLSTEFSSQKGVKGYPLHVVVDTYEDLESETAEPVHRAYCKVKIFRDKGAERKNKDETKNLDRRMQKFMKQRPGVSLDSDMGPTSVFHPPNRETALTSTSTFGPKPFLFVPEQVRLFRYLKAQEDGSPVPPPPVVHRETTSFLATIKERETKRTISNILSQAKEDLNHLEVGAPAKKAALIPDKPMITVYVRKEEAKVYNALLLDALTVHDFKLQIAKTYDVPPEMIKNVFKKTKKGLLVHLSAEMVSRFEDEDDFIIELPFDNQKGCFDLYVHY
jgi:transcription factor CP2-like protein